MALHFFHGSRFGDVLIHMLSLVGMVPPRRRSPTLNNPTLGNYVGS